MLCEKNITACTTILPAVKRKHMPFDSGNIDLDTVDLQAAVPPTGENDINGDDISNLLQV